MAKLWSLLLTLLTGRIAGKIIAPYLFLILLLAIGAVFLVTNSLFASLTERYTNQLIDSGRKVNEAMVKLETEQIQALRLMTNTTGVPEAIEAKDLARLQELLLPLQANANLDLVEVVDADLNLLLILRGEELASQAAQLFDPGLPRWALTAKVLAGQADQLGDKWTELVQTSWGVALYSVAPVKYDGRVIGAVLAGSPLPRVLKRLQEDAQTNVTLYNLDGSVMATSLPIEEAVMGAPSGQDAGAQKADTQAGGPTSSPQPPARPERVPSPQASSPRAAAGQIRLEITPEVAQQVLSPKPVILRRAIDLRVRSYQELVGALEIRAQPAVPLGVALPVGFIAQKAVESRDTLMKLFGGVVIFVLGLGLVVARQITRPIGILVEAHHAVQAGNLEAEAPVMTRDETGVLSKSFNQMVAGLREREHIRNMFGQYVTQQVAEAVLRGEVKMGGDRKEVTMLMTDIRSFTTLSESMAPEELVTMLNRYFNEMIDAIVEFEGTLDKFVGDAIVTEYNVPLPLDHHALRGVLTALRMREKLAAYNAAQIARGEPIIRIGMGVHTGPAVVGNIGSEGKKLEYTAMGDTVNVSSRLEGLTKELGTDIAISVDTYEQVRDWVDVGEPVETSVKGRVEPIVVYTLTGLKPGLEVGFHLIEQTRQQQPAPLEVSVPEPQPALVGAGGR